MRNLIIAILLIACTDFDVENSLLPYFEDFKMEAKIRGVKLEYKSVYISLQKGLADSKGYLAYGQDKLNGDKSVVVDKDFWETATESHRELVLYHEFGHSFLCRSHEYLKLSVMNTPVRVDEWINQRIEMMDELFENRDCD